MLSATEIISKLEMEFPKLYKFFKPEFRKIQDMVYRERKLMNND